MLLLAFRARVQKWKRILFFENLQNAKIARRLLRSPGDCTLNCIVTSLYTHFSLRSSDLAVSNFNKQENRTNDAPSSDVPTSSIRVDYTLSLYDAAQYTVTAAAVAGGGGRDDKREEKAKFALVALFLTFCLEARVL